LYKLAKRIHFESLNNYAFFRGMERPAVVWISLPLFLFVKAKLFNTPALPETGLFLSAVYFPVRPEAVLRDTNNPVRLFIDARKMLYLAVGTRSAARIIRFPVCPQPTGKYLELWRP
jgi:hypothetical protein